MHVDNKKKIKNKPNWKAWVRFCKKKRQKYKEEVPTKTIKCINKLMIPSRSQISPSTLGAKAKTIAITGEPISEASTPR